MFLNELKLTYILSLVNNNKPNIYLQDYNKQVSLSKQINLSEQLNLSRLTDLSKILQEKDSITEIAGHKSIYPI